MNYSKPFRAKYPGKCETCGEAFDEGDLIRLTDDRATVHAVAGDCLGDPAVDVNWTNVPVCTLCWTQHRGECA
ncbi:hypothetical protein SEA_TAQUITO_65 [Mycobacterium phage Taquito]|uniref:Uncharacterized protein n=6 Tax=Fionnbharthvirus TaxID=2948708 RepID=A0A6G6XSZ3_9CAUD|nr:hypothetical protein ACQ59_gp67 [Mycobacterium phage Fionnbharth]YP_009215664.1 hypothetical protein PBI_CHEETOBRO_66 [Mycobacterium phage Cheetobro]YP_009950408.1 hypothetical protein I5G69_gp69 [Mycobacterium phage Eponine]YP_009950501.1 hypothetical protein I5G70_gp68 [Mycobacterium phage Taquito]ALA46337.1 hypothetical protein PBI_SLARP_66 [Mycobacterium phage Slarp]APD19193.1 hypothetical protein SEA_MITTI_66 [Mycobacterium phage Mitti]ASR87773.1 hypothetical protein WINTERMUTE_66 [My